MKELDWHDYYDAEQPVIYIAGPYSAPTEIGILDNIRKACEARDRLIENGWAVVCPHANTANMDNTNPGIYYRMDLALLARCNAIYMLKGWEHSVGATMEREFAGWLQRQGKPMAILLERSWRSVEPTPEQYREWCAMEELDRQTTEELGMLDETVTNEHGGKQSKIEHRLSLLPPEAVLRVGAILTTGAAKYGDDNWRLITQRDHLDHALRHIVLHLKGDTNDDHLGNAACRMLFAISELKESDE